jgi:hypothetical protein
MPALIKEAVGAGGTGASNWSEPTKSSSMGFQDFIPDDVPEEGFVNEAVDDDEEKDPDEYEQPHRVVDIGDISDQPRTRRRGAEGEEIPEPEIVLDKPDILGLDSPDESFEGNEIELQYKEWRELIAEAIEDEDYHKALKIAQEASQDEDLGPDFCAKFSKWANQISQIVQVIKASDEEAAQQPLSANPEYEKSEPVIPRVTLGDIQKAAEKTKLARSTTLPRKPGVKKGQKLTRIPKVKDLVLQKVNDDDLSSLISKYLTPEEIAAQAVPESPSYRELQNMEAASGEEIRRYTDDELKGLDVQKILDKEKKARKRVNTETRPGQSDEMLGFRPDPNWKGKKLTTLQRHFITKYGRMPRTFSPKYIRKYIEKYKSGPPAEPADIILQKEREGKEIDPELLNGLLMSDMEWELWQRRNKTPEWPEGNRTEKQKDEDPWIPKEKGFIPDEQGPGLQNIERAALGRHYKRQAEEEANLHAQRQLDKFDDLPTPLYFGKKKGGVTILSKFDKKKIKETEKERKARKAKKDEPYKEREESYDTGEPMVDAVNQMANHPEAYEQLSSITDVTKGRFALIDATKKQPRFSNEVDPDNPKFDSEKFLKYWFEVSCARDSEFLRAYNRRYHKEGRGEHMLREDGLFWVPLISFEGDTDVAISDGPHYFWDTHSVDKETGKIKPKWVKLSRTLDRVPLDERDAKDVAKVAQKEKAQKRASNWWEQNQWMTPEDFATLNAEAEEAANLALADKETAEERRTRLTTPPKEIRDEYEEYTVIDPVSGMPIETRFRHKDTGDIYGAKSGIPAWAQRQMRANFDQYKQKIRNPKGDFAASIKKKTDGSILAKADAEAKERMAARRKLLGLPPLKEPKIKEILVMKLTDFFLNEQSLPGSGPTSSTDAPEYSIEQNGQGTTMQVPPGVFQSGDSAPATGDPGFGEEQAPNPGDPAEMGGFGMDQPGQQPQKPSANEPPSIQDQLAGDPGFGAPPGEDGRPMQDEDNKAQVNA